MVVLLVGFSLYLLYGLSISNRLLIVTNIVSIVATVTTLVVPISGRGRAPESSPVVAG